MYANIIFFQGGEATEYFELLNKHGEDYLLDYLAQWDFGEYYDTEEEPFHGKYDSVYEKGDYTLSYNYHLDYISLTKKLY